VAEETRRVRARRQRVLFVELLPLETRRAEIQAELRGIYEGDETDRRNPPLSRDDGYGGKVPAPALLLELDTGPAAADQAECLRKRFYDVSVGSAQSRPVCAV
jgi:hypothetical protein